MLITRTPGESYRSCCFVSRLSSADQLLSFLGKLICWFLPKNILTVTLGKLITDGMKHNLGSFESIDTTLNATVSFFDRDVLESTSQGHIWANHTFKIRLHRGETRTSHRITGTMLVYKFWRRHILGKIPYFHLFTADRSWNGMLCDLKKKKKKNSR